MRHIAVFRLIMVVLVMMWFELTLLPSLAVQGIRADSFLIFIAFYAFRVNWKQVWFVALLFGFAKELLSNSFFGVEAASYTTGAFLLEFLARRFDREDRWIQIASLFSGAWAVSVSYAAFSLLTGQSFVFAGQVLFQSFPTALYTAAMGTFLFPLFDKWLRPQLKTRQYELF